MRGLDGESSHLTKLSLRAGTSYVAYGAQDPLMAAAGVYAIYAAML